MTSLGRGSRGMERQRYSSYGAVDQTKIAKLIWQQQALAVESEFLRRGKQSWNFLPCSTAVNDASKAAIAALGNVTMSAVDQAILREKMDANAQKLTPAAPQELVQCVVGLCNKYKLEVEASELRLAARSATVVTVRHVPCPEAEALPAGQTLLDPGPHRRSLRYAEREGERGRERLGERASERERERERERRAGGGGEELARERPAPRAVCGWLRPGADGHSVLGPRLLAVDGLVESHAPVSPQLFGSAGALGSQARSFSTCLPLGHS
jgi:hypothetical protein